MKTLDELKTETIEELRARVKQLESEKAELGTMIAKLNSEKALDRDRVFHDHIKAHFEKEHSDWKVMSHGRGRPQTR